VLVHVRAIIANLARLESADHGGGVHEAAAASVDDHDAFLHRANGGVIDHVQRVLAERSVQTDDVAASKQLGQACVVQSYELSPQSDHKITTHH